MKDDNLIIIGEKLNAFRSRHSKRTRTRYQDDLGFPKKFELWDYIIFGLDQNQAYRKGDRQKEKRPQIKIR